MPIGAQPRGRYSRIASVILAASDAEAVTQTIELLWIDGVYDKAAIRQHVDNWPMRHFDRHRHSTRITSDTRQPFTQFCQPGAAVEKLPLTYDGARTIKNANLVLFRTPIDTNKPIHQVGDHDLSPIAVTRATTTPAGTCTGARRRNFLLGIRRGRPPGHMSTTGARCTSATPVAPGGSARLGS